VDGTPDDTELMRYLSATCSADERAAVEAWIAQDAERRPLVDLIVVAWNPAAPTDFDPDDAVRRRMHEQITAIARGRPSAPSLSLSPGGSDARAVWRRPVSWIVAAAATLLAVAGRRVIVDRHEHPASPPPVPATMREIVTPRGQRAAFMLADGTRIMLDADSRLQIPWSHFATSARHPGDREVSLVGRAFFQVTHDGTRPFRVRTANGVIEDLGTEFVVTAFPEQRNTQVVVAEGVVAVRSATAAAGSSPIVALTRGGMARVDGSGLARLNDRVDIARYLAWTKGSHVFKRTRLAEAIAELERWYDVDIRVADAGLLDLRFTASFTGESLGQVLEVLSVALDLEAERGERTVLLRARTASARP